MINRHARTSQPDIDAISLEEFGNLVSRSAWRKIADDK
jgi:hypothetical protein